MIGGGDFSADRIIPDCVRAAVKKEKIIVRNPYSIRPYQHVLEPLSAYLMVMQRQYEDINLSGYYNVGPDDSGCVSTGHLADLFCRAWGSRQSWETPTGDRKSVHEDRLLKLDCSKIKAVFGWRPRWGITEAVEKTVEWTRAYYSNGDICSLMDRQISDYLKNGDK